MKLINLCIVKSWNLDFSKWSRIHDFFVFSTQNCIWLHSMSIQLVFATPQTDSEISKSGCIVAPVLRVRPKCEVSTKQSNLLENYYFFKIPKDPESSLLRDPPLMKLELSVSFRMVFDRMFQPTFSTLQKHFSIIFEWTRQLDG